MESQQGHQEVTVPVEVNCVKAVKGINAKLEHSGTIFPDEVRAILKMYHVEGLR